MGLRHIGQGAGSQAKLMFQSRCRDSWGCDQLESALALSISQGEFQSRCRDSWGCDWAGYVDRQYLLHVSVPLPGFMGLRLGLCIRVCVDDWFQSRCRDSWGCDFEFDKRLADLQDVSVPLPGFMGLRQQVDERLTQNALKVSVPLPGFMGLRPI